MASSLFSGFVLCYESLMIHKGYELTVVSVCSRISIGLGFVSHTRLPQPLGMNETLSDTSIVLCVARVVKVPFGFALTFNRAMRVASLYDQS